MKNGTIQQEGRTYYCAQLWEAMVAQNTELGRQMQQYFKTLSTIAAERDAALTRAADLERDLDFALERLERVAIESLRAKK